MASRVFRTAIPIRRRVATLALATVTVCSLAFPASALALVSVDDQELAHGDNSVGGGTATLSDTDLSMTDVTANNVYMDESLTVNFNGGNEIEDFAVGGSATVEVNFTGENEVEDMYAVDDSNVTVNADGHNDFEEINAYDNANVTVNVTGENDFEDIEARDNASITISGTDCQMKDIANIGEGEHDAGLYAEKGNVKIDHVTVNMKSETARVGSGSGNLIIDTSKVASEDDNEYTEIIAGGTMTITESVIDITGTVHSDGQMTIEHSDVKAEAPDAKYDTSPYRVYSKTGIELIREKNGEVKTGELDGQKVWYVDTDDGDDVDLEADGKPGYYGCDDDDDDDSDDSKTRATSSKTGDDTNLWAFAALVVASAGTAGFAARRRGKSA